MLRTCDIDGCPNHPRSVRGGVCSLHYLRFYKHGRYHRVLKKWRSREEYRAEWVKRNRGYSTKYMHKLRFGGLREAVMKSDGYKCRLCGMSDRDHLSTWGCHLTVDHINGRGRGYNKPDNDFENLQVLCLRCHGKKDILRHSRYEGSVNIT